MCQRLDEIGLFFYQRVLCPAETAEIWQKCADLIQASNIPHVTFFGGFTHKTQTDLNFCGVC